jgi:putative intracellular protease/amidase
MAAVMKAHRHHTKHARHAHRGHKPRVQAAVRQVHWIGRMVIGVAPRAWTLQAANDPIA